MDELTGYALRARDGDPLAEAAFVRASQPDVWRLCASLVDRQSADDLVQESYLRAFRALEKFEGRSTVRTWLLGIARRTCADHLRATVRRRNLDRRLRLVRTADAPDPAGAATAGDMLDALSDDQRSAFVLTQLAGLSYQEAATIEGVPVGTIRSRVARARAELVEALATAAAS
ncbi:MAG: polymerase sigma-70 factor, subfamily [Cryptosporangiaceae bacterium]|nr:polymerase sigma-70 factor, subfamily [Cryptosporangiaceae bacterium]